MPFVATLIAHPSNPILTASIGEAVATAVAASGLYWLCDGVACDVALPDGSDLEHVKKAILEVIGEQAIDFAIQDTEKRRKKLLIADMDSTMIEQECIDELAAEVGLKDKVAEITARAMN
jgi:phosphoserine phosphatase